MVEFTQENHNLLGSKEAVEALEKKENARVLAVSDSHGSLSVLHNIVMSFGSDCDALIFCGDGLGDLVSLLNNARNDSELAKCIPPVIAFVQGNNDAGHYSIFSGFAITAPQRQNLIVGGKNILITHGHRQGVEFGYEALAFEAQITESKYIVHGHTHIGGEGYFGQENEYKIINPGSCSRPRGGTPTGFAILTFGRNFEDTAFVKIERGIQGLSLSTFMPMGL